MAPRGLSTVLAMMVLYTRVARRVKCNFDIFEISPRGVGTCRRSAGRHRQNPAINPFRFVNQLLETWGDGFDELKQLRPSLDVMEKPAAGVRCGPCNLRDDSDVPLICPTCRRAEISSSKRAL